MWRGGFERRYCFEFFECQFELIDTLIELFRRATEFPTLEAREFKLQLLDQQRMRMKLGVLFAHQSLQAFDVVRQR